MIYFFMGLGTSPCSGGERKEKIKEKKWISQAPSLLEFSFLGYLSAGSYNFLYLVSENGPQIPQERQARMRA